MKKKYNNYLIIYLKKKNRTIHHNKKIKIKYKINKIEIIKYLTIQKMNKFKRIFMNVPRVVEEVLHKLIIFLIQKALYRHAKICAKVFQEKRK